MTVDRPQPQPERRRLVEGVGSRREDDNIVSIPVEERLGQERLARSYRAGKK
jgi:hypothetical protein